jgi:tricorn protease
MKKKTIFTTLLTLLISIQLLADDSPYVRYPDINSNGSQIAFSYQGDIWTVPTVGGKATRLTLHEAYDGFPLWSNDDNQIAFSS